MLKLTKYWPLSLNSIWMGDILSNISGGRLDDKVIILWIFCSELTGLLSDVASERSGREMLLAGTGGTLATGWKLLLWLRILMSPDNPTPTYFPY